MYRRLHAQRRGAIACVWERVLGAVRLVVRKGKWSSNSQLKPVPQFRAGRLKILIIPVLSVSSDQMACLLKVATFRL